MLRRHNPVKSSGAAQGLEGLESGSESGSYAPKGALQSKTPQKVKEISHPQMLASFRNSSGGRAPLPRAAAAFSTLLTWRPSMQPFED
tara:strand:- start:1898 stop:2161 length:264 start_codon:yes stop_codon:yes gene_type:complete